MKIPPDLLRFLLVTIAFSSILYGSHIFSDKQNEPQNIVQKVAKEPLATRNDLHTKATNLLAKQRHVMPLAQ